MTKVSFLEVKLCILPIVFVEWEPLREFVRPFGLNRIRGRGVGGAGWRSCVGANSGMSFGIKSKIKNKKSLQPSIGYRQYDCDQFGHLFYESLAANGLGSGRTAEILTTSIFLFLE
jgi:hypothetical protein